MAKKTAVIRSFAKINLFLDVVGKRPDGYHNIETIFQSIDLSDTLEIGLVNSGIMLSCRHPSVPLDDSNLVWQAFLAFAEATGYEGGVNIKIDKKIPPGTGLGGGSSNAGATLVALNQLKKTGLSEDELRKIAGGVGADVPFFITGGLAAGWEIGDRIKPLSASPDHYLIVAVPKGVTVSTADAYGMLNAPTREIPPNLTLPECGSKLKAFVNALDSGDIPSWNDVIGPMLFNALEAPVFSAHPEIGALKNQLLEAGARSVLMTGSGSGVFGLADSEEKANEIKTSVESSGSCQCFALQTVDSGWQFDT